MVRPSRTRLVLVALFLALAPAATTEAQAARRVDLRFTPTARAQLAVWIESADGQRMQTVRLTESVAFRGIGNRPGALQMNSGFRWPFGRREGVLPVWAHRRVANGQAPFSRVIFNGRRSEGNASSAGSIGEPRNTVDNHFCLSFNMERSGRDALDAVTCGSVFNSNKGRYLTGADVAAGYAEPWEDEARRGTMRPLASTSLYPPRRDVEACTTPSCGDHTDVGRYAVDARLAMPELDVVTMATPAGDRPQRIVFDMPEEWPDGEYVAYVEIHVEGDWNDTHDGDTYPTPVAPDATWDYWAVNYGYAYRGQPSVVYALPFLVSPAGGRFDAGMAVGLGALHGEDGELHPVTGMSDDPLGAPGSGVDRLRRGADGERLAVVVPPWNVCEQPDPPAMCGWECTPEDDRCGTPLICGPDMTCVGICDVPMQPGTVETLVLENHPDERSSHRWARLRFVVPASPRTILRYEVRVGTEPITDAQSFERALPAVEPSIERIELTVPVEGAPGDTVELDFGGLTPETRYFVAIRAVDECNAAGALTSATVTTTPIHFTTVSPCFVATAAYGSALEPRVGALRRLRDRHLAPSALGRFFIAAYERVGPHLAAAIRGDATREGLARALLTPIVALAETI